MKILITGASGKIGKHIVNFFIKKKIFLLFKFKEKNSHQYFTKKLYKLQKRYFKQILQNP